MISRFLGIVYIVISSASMLVATPNVDSDIGEVIIPFQVVNGLIIIEAEVDDRAGKYVFDTGAEEMILNSKVSNSNSVFASINGDISTEEVDINILKIGNLTQKKLKAYSADLESLQSYLNLSLAGIIGTHLFAPNIINIDYHSRQITLSDNDKSPSDLDYSIDFDMTDGTPVCSIELNGNTFLFGFDSGATMHVIDDDVKNQLAHFFTDTKRDTYVTTGTGEKTIHQIVEFSEFKLGNKVLLNQEFLVQSLVAFNQSMDQDIAGVLSLNTLHSGRVVIDIRNQKIYF